MFRRTWLSILNKLDRGSSGDRGTYGCELIDHRKALLEHLQGLLVDVAKSP
jgi:hypothetical protein